MIQVGWTSGREPEFDIIIPHRGSVLGLWATVHACEVALRYCEHDYGYIIVSNGEAYTTGHEDEFFTPKAELDNVIKFLRRSGKLRYHYHSEEPLSPPAARHLGTQFSFAKHLFFFDNHCVPAHDFFELALADLARPEIDMVHGGTSYNLGCHPTYEYELRLKIDFWGREKRIPQIVDAPYRIAVGGHGAFAVKRNVYEEVGGFWSGFVGYAGEETEFDLRMWMLGKSVWLDPRMLHYHYAGARPYARHFSDGYYTNLMCAAHIIGGEQWLDRLYHNFSKASVRKQSTRSMTELMREAEQRSSKRAAELAAKRLRTLDEQLEHFKQEGVSH